MDVTVQTQQWLILVDRLSDGYASNRNHLDASSHFQYGFQGFVQFWSLIEIRVVGWTVEVEDAILHVIHLRCHLLYYVSEFFFGLVAGTVPWRDVRMSRAYH